MRVNVKYAAFLILLFVAACSPFQVAATPQAAINEANIALTATAQQVTSNLKSGVMSSAEARSVLDEVKRYSVMVDEAQALLREGNETAAQQKLQLINAAITALHKQVAVKAKGG